MTSEETSVTVDRVIDAPAPAIFAILADPRRHPDVDSSGFLRAARSDLPITAQGETFVMDMEADFQGGPYTMVNHVTAFEDGSLIAWKPAELTSPDAPGGWEWRYRLTPQGDGRTVVALTYDWTDVTDPELIPIFPAFTPEELAESLRLLEVAAVAP